VLLAIPGILIGFAISFLLGCVISCLAFWTTRVYSISEFYYALAVLFSGQFVPLQLMPRVIQDIAQFLPFQMYRYVPIETILNRLPIEVVLRDYAVGLVWLGVSLVLFLWVWREGIKRFSAVGA
jgi:ABC-2 type transport system permease protein